jgi:hypothetical protein
MLPVLTIDAVRAALGDHVSTRGVLLGAAILVSTATAHT